MATSFTLTQQAADILSEDLSCDLRQFPFEIGHHGATVDERAQIRGTVWKELQQRKIADQDEIAPEAHHALTLLHKPDLTLAVTAADSHSGEVFRARIAASGRTGVQAIQDEHGLRISTIDPRGLARVCTDLLPDLAPGKLESATISAQPRQTGGGGESSWLSDAQPRQAGGPEMRKMQQIMALPTQRVGYIFVTGRDQHGKPVQLPAVGWRDTDKGRYSVTTRRNHDGQDWTTIAAADKQRLATYIGDQLKAFAQRVRG